MQLHAPADRALAAVPIRHWQAAWFAGALASLALALAGIFPIDNADTFGHLAQGREIAELGYVPLHDTRSFWRAEPAPFRNYEWLSDLGVWFAYREGGASALLAGKALLLALGAALLVALAGLLGGTRSAVLCAGWLIAAIPAARFRFSVRPHLVALPLVALQLIGLAYLMRAWGKGRRSADLAIAIGLTCTHALWVNLHGSHLLGLLITALHLACAPRGGGARGRIAALLALQLGASCLSPYGPAIALDAIGHVFDPRYRELVGEWQPLDADDPQGLVLALILQTAALLALVRPLWREGREGRALLLLGLVLALAALRSVRFVAEYVLLTAPVIAIGLRATLAALPARRFTRGALALLPLLLISAPLAASRLPPHVGVAGGERYAGLPAASGSWLRAHAVAPRVLAAIEDAWFLMFAVKDARFLVDGRVPFYGPEHLMRVRAAIDDPSRLPALLARYRVDSVVVHHTSEPFRPLLAAMRSMPGFRLVSLEDRHALFVSEQLRLQPGAQAPALDLGGYETDWILNADPAREQAILAQLDRLPRHPNVDGYRGFVRGLLALKPLLRAGHNGLPAPRDPQQSETLARAQRWLGQAASGASGVPIVHAYHALVAAARCDLDLAEQALQLAGERESSRETLLGAQEIALRRGHAAEVAAFVRRAQAVPGAAGDRWLSELAAAAADPTTLNCR